jgi:choline kinase/phosphatidylglycerophosphate synthase
MSNIFPLGSSDRPGTEWPTAPSLIGELRRPTVGLVLAAGRSQRLAGVTGGGSKALVRVGGLTLVERAVRTLLRIGIERVVVVVGFEAGPVAAVATRAAPGRVQAVPANDWELGNGASLAAAGAQLVDQDLFLLVTADHMFGEGALELLVGAERPSALVQEAPGIAAWTEGTRVRLHGRHAVEFSKDLAVPAIDCGAFLLPPAVFDAQQRVQARGDASLAGALTELARETPLNAVPLPNDSWWEDIDTHEDLRRAATQLRRSLTRETDGPVSRYLNRAVSSRLSMAIAHLPIHPDMVSLLAFITGIGAALLFARAQGIAGAVLVVLASILDGVDGEIARLQVRASPDGALLDGVLDRVADAAIIAGVAVWASHLATETTVLVLAVAAVTGSMMSMASKDRIAALGLPSPPEHWIGFLFGGRDARVAITAVAGILGWPLVALVAISATSAMSLMARLLFVWRRGSD